LYGEREECRQVLERVGFEGTSMSYDTRAVEWRLPDAGYYFEAETQRRRSYRGHSVAAIAGNVEKIRLAIENGIKQYARGNEFVLPMAANVIVVRRTRLSPRGAVAAALWAARSLRAPKRIQDGTTQSRRRSSIPRQLLQPKQ